MVEPPKKVRNFPRTKPISEQQVREQYAARKQNAVLELYRAAIVDLRSRKLLPNGMEKPDKMAKLRLAQAVDDIAGFINREME